MRTIRTVIVWSLFCMPTLYSFFWVPNRYNTPFWSGDTRITSSNINSWDGYLGRSYNTEASIDCTSIDAGLCMYQTIVHGFFGEISVPITSMKLRSDTVMQAGGLSYSNCSLFAGWGINYDQLRLLDFIDCMIRIGVFTPAHKPLHEPFLELYGYHAWGFPIALDIALGLCEWITCGFHASGSFLANDTAIWHLQPYAKADHFAYGISAWFGYSYTGSAHDGEHPPFFSEPCSWHMHTLHYGLEYECIQAEFPIHPRIGCYLNQYIGGENTFKRTNFGITAGLDITW